MVKLYCYFSTPISPDLQIKITKKEKKTKSGSQIYLDAEAYKFFTEFNFPPCFMSLIGKVLSMGSGKRSVAKCLYHAEQIPTK